MNKPDSQTIEDAVDIIKAHGLHKGSFHSHKGGITGEIVRSCALGSLAVAMGTTAYAVSMKEENKVRYERLRSALDTDLKILNHRCMQVTLGCNGNLCGNIAHYNDAKSAEEVIDLMMTTAKRLRNEGR